MISSRLLTARRGRDRGFTLVEMLATIVILGLLGAAMSLMVTSTARKSTTARQRLVATQEAQTAIDHIGAELRAASPQTTSVPATAFTLADTNHVTFVSSLGATTGPSLVDISLASGDLQEQVTTPAAGGPPYVWSGTPITRDLAEVGTATTTLFTYYDKNGNVLSTPMTSATTTSAIDHVTVTLVTQESNLGGPVTVSTTVYPRDVEYGS